MGKEIHSIPSLQKDYIDSIFSIFSWGWLREKVTEVWKSTRSKSRSRKLQMGSSTNFWWWKNSGDPPSIISGRIWHEWASSTLRAAGFWADFGWSYHHRKDPLSDESRWLEIPRCVWLPRALNMQKISSFFFFIKLMRICTLTRLLKFTQMILFVTFEYVTVNSMLILFAHLIAPELELIWSVLFRRRTNQAWLNDGMTDWLTQLTSNK